MSYDPAWRWIVQRWDGGEWIDIDPSFDTKKSADSNARVWRRGGWKVRVIHPTWRSQEPDQSTEA